MHPHMQLVACRTHCAVPLKPLALGPVMPVDSQENGSAFRLGYETFKSPTVPGDEESSDMTEWRFDIPSGSFYNLFSCVLRYLRIVSWFIVLRPPSRLPRPGEKIELTLLLRRNSERSLITWLLNLDHRGRSD